jgi:hypothetical protein
MSIENSPTGFVSKLKVIFYFAKFKFLLKLSFINYRQPQDLHMIGGKNLRSPSKMQAPKKYTTTPTNITSPSATPRTPNKQLHTTPKKTLPANR